MPRFSANIGFLFPELGLIERIYAAKRAGFRAIELHWPYQTPAEQVAQAARQNGLDVLAINTPVGDMQGGEYGLAAVPGREEDYRAAADQAVEYASIIGAKAVHCMGGIVPDHDRDACRKVFEANVRMTCEKAASAGLDVYLEPINNRDRPGYFLNRVELAADIIGHLALPNLKIMFDCYHAQIIQGDILTLLRKYIHVIGHVQIASVPDRVEPDTGELNYKAVFEELDRLGYGGWVGAEYNPRGATEAGLTWVRDYL